MARQAGRISRRHLSLCCRILVAMQALAAPGAWAEVYESSTSYELVVREALAAVPEPLRAFFGNTSRTVYEAALGNVVAGRPGHAHPSPHRHMVTLDAAVEDDASDADRLSAVGGFPRAQHLAESLYRKHGLTGGLLPWVIDEQRAALVEAFRARDWEAVPLRCGMLLHSLTDAGLPFHASRTGADIDGWPTEAEGEMAALERRAAGRIQVVLVDRARDRLAYEVRVFHARAERLENPTDAVFGLLQQSCLEAAGLDRIDREIIAQLGIRDASSWQAHRNEYYRLLEVRVLPVLRRQLESAALLGANLICTAWSDAGSPLPPAFPAMTAPSPSAIVPAVNATARVTGGRSEQPPRSPRDAAPDGSATAPATSSDSALNSVNFVGSMSSQVFHRATCRHAQRIKVENLVRFANSAAARKAGRTPCKSCQPDGP